MNDTPEYFYHNADEDMIQDLIDFFNESYEIVEHNFSVYTSSSDKPILIDQAFRSIHTIKSHATVCEINPVVQLTQSIEDTVYALKAGRIEFSEILCDSILLSMDRLKELITAIIDQTPIDNANLVAVQGLLSEVARSKKMEYLAKSKKLIEVITGQFSDAPAVAPNQADISVAVPQPAGESASAGAPASAPTGKPASAPTGKPASAPASKPASAPAKPAEQAAKPAPVAASTPTAPRATASAAKSSREKTLDDMTFFQLLAKRVDDHSPDWENRSTQQLELAMKINNHAGKLIDQQDLTAAVYLHDIGMAFVPSRILLKEGRLDQDELKVLQKHPFFGAEIVSRFPAWKHIEPMILQHHERPDGSGYPFGINQETLCEGARLLAILDAYFAMTNYRADRKHKRSKLRAISEINACSGTQFCQKWVKHFNAVMLEK